MKYRNNRFSDERIFHSWGHITVILFSAIILFAIVSCKHEGYPHILMEADRLADQDPDSALRLLKSIEERMSLEPEATEMYWKLLMIKASDKSYEPICTPAESERIVRYYSDSGDKELLPEALYYAGRVYRTYNDALEARKYFLRAIEEIDKSNTPDDFNRLKGKCLSQIGSVYLYQDLCGESVRMYQRAFEINHESNDTVGMIFNLRDVANAYLSMSKPDSSLIFSNRGIGLASATCDTLFLNELYLLRSAAEIECGDYKNAQHDLEKAESMFSGKPSIAQLTIGARLAYAIGDTVECGRIARKMFTEGNIHDKRWAARILAELMLRADNPGESMNMIKEYIILDDSVTKINRASTILKMNALYDYSRKEAENTALKAQNSKLVWIFWTSVALLASLFVSGMLYLRYKKQQHALMKLKIEKLEAMRKKYEAKDIVTIKKENASIESSEIYKLINRQINSPEGPKGLDESQWDEVSKAIETISPNFKQRLVSLCKMNDNEIKVCLLIKMGFAPSVIAALTYHSKESVSATRRRLFEKAFGQKRTPHEWDEFIRSM